MKKNTIIITLLIISGLFVLSVSPIAIAKEAKNSRELKDVPIEYLNPSYSGAAAYPKEESAIWTKIAILITILATIIFVFRRDMLLRMWKSYVLPFFASDNNTQINKWKIFGYTVITWFSLSVLASLLLDIRVMAGEPYVTIVDAQGVVWGWASLIMGIYLTVKLKKGDELIWGAILVFVCTLPVIGFLIGIGYFVRAYAKLEKEKLLIESPNQSTLNEF